MMGIIDKDTMTPIQETVGDTALMETLARFAADVASNALKIASQVRGDFPYYERSQKLSDEFKASWNGLMLCAECLHIEPDQLMQGITLAKWHDELAMLGKEDDPVSLSMNEEVIAKFKDAAYMEGDE